jgi:hypothetical protein
LMLIIISIIHPDGRGRWGNASIWVYIFSWNTEKLLGACWTNGVPLTTLW